MKAAIVKEKHHHQVIDIPEEYHLNTKQVWIKKKGNMLIIVPKPSSWDDFFDSPLQLSDDFSMERNQAIPQKRDHLFS